MPIIATGQLVAGVATLLCVGSSIPLAIPVTALAALKLIESRSLAFGRDGSDDMALVVTVALALAAIAPHDDWVGRLSLGFIALQLCLAYGASGIAKLGGSLWRAGDALRAVLHTSSYGNGPLASRLDRFPEIGRLLNWLVVAGEICFPIAIALGGTVALVALGVSATFHLAIGATMGLNRFSAWFLATLPATGWLASTHGLLSR